MPKVLDSFIANSAYAFLLVGLAWLGVAILSASLLLLWPVVACLLSGVLLKVRPGLRFTWAWAVSSAVLGLLLSAYQVYAWAPYLGGAFSTLAEGTLAGFAVLAAAHVMLLYAGALKPKSTKSMPS
jgi:hypothetical protein